jgi:hypothetical protein
VAGAAGVLHHLAGAVALRAGLLDGEEALLHPDLARSVAGRAGDRLGARLGAGAFAGAALVHGRNADARIGAARRLFERDLEVVAQICAAIDAAPAAAAAPPSAGIAEDFAEYVAEGIAEALTTTSAATHVRVDAGVAVLVIGGTFLSVGQDFVCFLCFLELVFRFLAVRIAVRVVLHRQLAVRLLDLVVRGIPVDAEDFVKVAFCHLLSPQIRQGTEVQGDDPASLCPGGQVAIGNRKSLLTSCRSLRCIRRQPHRRHPCPNFHPARRHLPLPPLPAAAHTWLRRASVRPLKALRSWPRSLPCHRNDGIFGFLQRLFDCGLFGRIDLVAVLASALRVECTRASA